MANDTEKVRTLLVLGQVHSQNVEARMALAGCLWSLDWLDLTITEDPDAVVAERLAPVQCLILYGGGREVTDAQLQGLNSWIASGGGLVGVHGATITGDGRPEYHELLGSRFITHPAISQMTTRVADPDHFITQGMSDFGLHDECYMSEYPDRDALHILMTGHREMSEDDWRLLLERHPEMAQSEGQPLNEPSTYVREIGAGRLFYCALGHTGPALEVPMVQRLLTRGIAWAARREALAGE